MDDTDLKEPLSPQLSSDFLTLLNNEKFKTTGTSITFPQNSKSSCSFVSTSDDSKRIQSKISKVAQKSEECASSSRSSLFNSFINLPTVKRPTNIDVNTLRIPVFESESAEDQMQNPQNLQSAQVDTCELANNVAKSKTGQTLYSGSNSQRRPEIKSHQQFQPICSAQTPSTYFTPEENRTENESRPIFSSTKSSAKSTGGVTSKENNTDKCETRSVASDVMTINEQNYKLMRILGEGGSSKVYEAYSHERMLVAIKHINLSMADKRSSESFVNEITVLKRLQHSDRVIKLFDYEHKTDSKCLLVALERGDTDFATYLKSRSTQNQITAELIKFYWSEMLRAVDVIHTAGIIHSDLKPANFLIVKGHLKLIDFGISSFIPSDVTSIVKDTRVGSVSYISPEALTDLQDDNRDSSSPVESRFKISVKSDVWSLGCILYHMVYGTTPFSQIKNLVKTMTAIMNPNYCIVYPPVNDKILLDVMQNCIVREPKHRASIKELIDHPYLTAKPEKNFDSFLHQLMVKLSPTSSDKVYKAFEQLQMDK